MSLARWFPFLTWFPIRREALTADVVAGLTVAMVLVPQAMAYAQLAGLPAYHGLYAAFLPVIVGALWGSSHHLATGPVAVTSLLTASPLRRWRRRGRSQFVALAVLLALLAGPVRRAARRLPARRHRELPVAPGDGRASPMRPPSSSPSRSCTGSLGVPTGRSERFLRDVWAVLLQIGETHLPTLADGARHPGHHRGDAAISAAACPACSWRSSSPRW